MVPELKAKWTAVPPSAGFLLCSDQESHFTGNQRKYFLWRCGERKQPFVTSQLQSVVQEKGCGRF